MGSSSILLVLIKVFLEEDAVQASLVCYHITAFIIDILTIRIDDVENVNWHISNAVAGVCIKKQFYNFFYFLFPFVHWRLSVGRGLTCVCVQLFKI